jgi:hypothetical protein
VRWAGSVDHRAAWMPIGVLTHDELDTVSLPAPSMTRSGPSYLR